MKYKEYKNLTNFLLGPVRKRPAMYLGNGNIKLSSIQNLITGYNIGFEMARNEDVSFDDYFGEDGFVSWFLKKKNIEKISFWETLLLEEANYDEEKALYLYFDYLEEYNKGKS